MKLNKLSEIRTTMLIWNARQLIINWSDREEKNSDV